MGYYGGFIIGDSSLTDYAGLCPGLGTGLYLSLEVTGVKSFPDGNELGDSMILISPAEAFTSYTASNDDLVTGTLVDTVA